MGISSDGDPKLLAAMNHHVFHSLTPVTQDTSHIAAKLRNRLLHEGVNLMMGTSKVSVNHLKALVRDVQKSVHGLTYMDVHPIDRMNLVSFEKIVRPRVVNALNNYINNSEGTIKYLNICNDVTSCYLDFDLTPSERILRMWRSLFFLRIWRHFILSSRSYTLGKNFITTNAYTCVEINARTLILLIKKFRDENTPEQFLPTMFDSQMCEKTFRLFRSMGTTQFTKINFSLYELLFMIGRVEVTNIISYSKLANIGIKFPNRREGKTTIYPLPSDSEINAVIAEARKIAIEEAAEFGMTDISEIDEFDFVSNLPIDENEGDVSDNESMENELISHTEDDYVAGCESFGTVESENIDENSHLIGINDENGVEKIVRKSTLIWMLCERSEAPSRDRLRRFHLNPNKRQKKHDE